MNKFRAYLAISFLLIVATSPACNKTEETSQDYRSMREKKMDEKPRFEPTAGADSSEKPKTIEKSSPDLAPRESAEEKTIAFPAPAAQSVERAADTVARVRLRIPQDIGKSIEKHAMKSGAKGKARKRANHAKAAEEDSFIKNSPLKPIAEVHWNSWLHPAGFVGGERTSVLTVGKTYSITLDLSPYAYKAAGVHVETPSHSFQQELNRLSVDILTVYIRPALVGRGLKFLPGENQVRRFDINLKKLRQPGPVRASNEPIMQFAERVQAGKIKLDLEATEAGCAGIALSIWNRKLDRPIDDYVHPVTIQNEHSDAPDCDDKSPTITERSSTHELSLLEDEPDVKVDAGLHIFEMKFADELHTAVFYGEQGKGYAWAVKNAFSTVSSDYNFLQALTAARESGDYQAVGDVLSRALFSTETPENEEQAELAQAALEKLMLTPRDRRPSVFARLVDTDGRNIFLPLGLLKVGSTLLGEKATLIQPLPEQTYRQPGKCIAKWNWALPETLDHVTLDLYNNYLKAIDPTSPPRLRTLDKLKTYVADKTERKDPEGFLLLAHHSNGNVWYDKAAEYIMSSDVFHKYGRGSVAILAACNVGDLNVAPKRLALLTRLNALGIDAAVVSPFEVPAELGVVTAIHFHKQLIAAYEKMKTDGVKGPMLLELFDRTIDAVRSDPALQFIKANPMYEFILAGNGGLTLCLP